MIYFERCKDGSINKWDITYDEEDLRSIREEVIKNFSSIYSSKKTSIKRSLNDGNDVTMLYYEFSHPKLIGLIDKLLLNDFSVLQEIEAPKETGQNYYEDLIISLDDEIDTIDNFDVDRKIKKLQELKEVLNKRNLNKNNNGLSRYYEMVQSIINMMLLDHMDEEEVEKLEDFFEMSVDKVIKDKQKRLGSR